jgi:ribosome maturation factor RimP
MADNDNIDKLMGIIEPVCEDAGFELCELTFAREQVGWVLRVYIDHALPDKPGVTFADCERLSKELSAVLDVADPVDCHYSLEVSSPGLDRPLRKITHFQRFIGHEARVKLREPREGRKNFQGVLLSADPDDIAMRVDGKAVHLPPGSIQSAKLVPDWTACMKEMSGGKR